MNRVNTKRMRKAQRRRRQSGVLGQLEVCHEKINYPTEQAARRASDALWRRYGGIKLRAYECRMCGEWHLTKKAPR